jgi:Uma2 family endonuclease
MVLLHDTDRPTLPPTNLESIEPPLETKRHLYQIILLLQCLEYLWRDRTDFFAAGNLTIYYSLRQIKNQDFRGPDFFVVQGTERRDRKSWTVWEEDGKYPNVIVEILSDSTEQVDDLRSVGDHRGLKKQLYQDVFHTHEYFWFHPYTLEFAGWRLDGKQYQPIVPTTEGWLWSEELQLYLGLHNQQLRYFAPDRSLVPTPEEAADQAETAIATMRQKMLDRGINPDSE